jgi:hypothetical protein
MADDVAFGEDVTDFAFDVHAGDAFEGVGLGDSRLALDDDAFDFDGDGDALLARFEFELASDFAFAFDVRAGDAFEGVGLGDLRLALDDDAFDFDGDGDALLARFEFELASDFADPSLRRCFDLVLPRALAVDCLPFAAFGLTMVHSKI